MTIQDYSRVDMERGEGGTVFKDVTSYNAEDVNFLTPGEITIEITLKEYRTLIATAAICKERESQNRDSRAEAKRLQEENEILQEQNKRLSEALAVMAGGKEVTPE